MDTEFLYRTIGERIKARRRQLEMTQERLAELLGCSRASLANIETGRQKVLVHNLYTFARSLKLEVTDLLPVEQRESSTSVGTGPVLAFSSPLTKSQKHQIGRFLTTATGELSSKVGR